MTKFLVVLLVVVALWVLLKRPRGARRDRAASGRGPASASPPPSEAPAQSAQDMVRCAHCGVHLPASDAVRSGVHSYCCAEHAAAGPSGP
jgi:uncharacterized protein